MPQASLPGNRSNPIFKVSPGNFDKCQSRHTLSFISHNRADGAETNCWHHLSMLGEVASSLKGGSALTRAGCEFWGLGLRV